MRISAWMKAACIIILFTGFWGCETAPQLSDKDALEEITKIEDPAARAKALEGFLSDYPDSSLKSKVLRRVFDAYVELKDAEKADSAADAIFEGRPEEGRADLYNSLAWGLAEAELLLDRAEEYASKAVEQTRETGGRRFASNLDTYAYVLFKKGDFARAEEVQLEALKDNGNMPDFVERLALYKHAGGKLEESIDALAQSLLAGGSDEGWAYLVQWRDELDPDPAKTQSRVKDILGRRIYAYLQESDTPKRRARAAELLSRSGADVEMGERWARKAFADLGNEMTQVEEFEARGSLAAVLMAAGKTSEALAMLQTVQDRAPLYDTGYWRSLGQGYAAVGNQEEAVRAFVEGMVFREDEAIRGELRKASLGDAEIDARVSARKDELLNFDPGKWDAPVESNGRVVLAELFTGAECNPCQAADHAFDLLSQYYPRTSLVILEHHLHIPGADPLTNPSSLARYEYYGGGFGTPTTFINGAERMTGGGPAVLKKNYYLQYKDVIDRSLKGSTVPSLEPKVRHDGDAVTVHVDTLPLGDDTEHLDLHVALVENSVEYLGGNTIGHHAFVVRHLTDGVSGVALKRPEVRIVIREIKLDKIEAGLNEYLDGFEKSPPERYQGFGGWTQRPVQLNRDNLAIVVWVQDRETKQVVQSAYVGI